MIQSTLTTLPMLVCAILTALLALSLYRDKDGPRIRLLVFMIVATLLYTAHCIYFNGLKQTIPFSDTVYCFCNPAVYPLYYIYRGTDAAPPRPPAAGTAAGARSVVFTYGGCLLSADERRGDGDVHQPLPVSR